MSNQFDLSYRPDTYWPESLDREQLLARIQGEARRDIVRQTLDEGDISDLDPVLAAEELDEENRRGWGLIHPAHMGGEYLPSLGAEDVEIARISLASVTSDQISIRASNTGGQIRYSVCDEYETEYDLAFTYSEHPLRLGELVKLIDGSGHPEEREGGGLLVCHWEHMLESHSDLEYCTAFAWIESAWYPELAAYYDQVASEWQEQKRRLLGQDAEEEARA
jgi:hypothetical protein